MAVGKNGWKWTACWLCLYPNPEIWLLQVKNTGSCCRKHTTGFMVQLFPASKCSSETQVMAVSQGGYSMALHPLVRATIHLYAETASQEFIGKRGVNLVQLSPWFKLCYLYLFCEINMLYIKILRYILLCKGHSELLFQVRVWFHSK